MPQAIQISDAEWEVMQVVWPGQPMTAAEVIASLADSRDWNHRTVRTLLARLVEKGALAYDVDGARYIYRAQVSREQCVRHESRSFASKVFGGDVAALLAHFVEDTSLTTDEVERLRQLLDAKDSAAAKQSSQPRSQT